MHIPKVTRQRIKRCAVAFNLLLLLTISCWHYRAVLVPSAEPFRGNTKAQIHKGAFASLTLTAADGTPPIRWSLTDGELPPGVWLTPAGAISGTPSETGTFAFTATATNPIGSTSKHFRITVAP